MLDDSHWSKANEKFVLKVRDFIIEQALEDGYDVIVDDTNFAPRHEQSLKNIIDKFKVRSDKPWEIELETKEFHTPLEECIERDLKRQNSVGEKVIRKMYYQYIVDPVEAPKIDSTLPDAILVDVDGTLALMNGRGPFDWKDVGSDLPNKAIIELVNQYKTRAHVQMIVLSGRDGICNQETKEWLDKNGVEYDELLMREVKDNRKDCVIKKEIYDNKIKGRFNIKIVFDDRQQVVDMWRSLGLTCVQVGYGDF